jgi:hypothetical protein
VPLHRKTINTLPARKLLPPSVQEWLLARLPRTPAALREAAGRLDGAALATGRVVT